MSKWFKLIVLLVLVVLPSEIFAENLYVTQSGAGSHTGLSLANAWSVSEFNTTGNWGTGTGLIGGGDIVYLSGTITSNITLAGSGASSSSRVTIDGASATLSNSFTSSSKSYWTLQNVTWSSGRTTVCVTITGGSYMTINNMTVPSPVFGSTGTMIRLVGGSSNLTLKNVTGTNLDRTGPTDGMGSAIHAYCSTANGPLQNVLLDGWNITTTTNARGNINRDMFYWTYLDGLTIQNSIFNYRWQGNGPDTGGGQPHNDLMQFTGNWSGTGGRGCKNITIRNNHFITNINGLPSQTDAHLMNSNAGAGYWDVYGNIFENRGSVIGYAMLHLANSVHAEVHDASKNAFVGGVSKWLAYTLLY